MTRLGSESTAGSVRSPRPGMEVFEVSAKTGAGLERWLTFLQARREKLPKSSETSEVC
jgi:hypothetical protein